MPKTKKTKNRQKFPWVLPEGQKLPKMTRVPSKKYDLPLRTPKEDEKVLRPARSVPTEMPCKHGEKCVAVQVRRFYCFIKNIFSKIKILNIKRILLEAPVCPAWLPFPQRSVFCVSVRARWDMRPFEVFFTTSYSSLPHTEKKVHLHDHPERNPSHQQDHPTL